MPPTDDADLPPAPQRAWADRLAQQFPTGRRLAARVRRTAESPADPSRSTPIWHGPVPLVDVLRCAVAEVEHDSRVDVDVPSSPHVDGLAAADLVRLFAELCENAVRFSPRDTRVQVSSRVVRAGIVVAVRDHGTGMSREQLAEVAEVLDATAPDGRRGLQVVARLAARHAVALRLQCATPGTLVEVGVPVELLSDVEEAAQGVPEQRQAPADPAVAPAAVDVLPGAVAPAAVASAAALPAPRHARPLLGDALPTRFPRASVPPPLKRSWAPHTEAD